MSLLVAFSVPNIQKMNITIFPTKVLHKLKRIKNRNVLLKFNIIQL